MVKSAKYVPDDVADQFALRRILDLLAAGENAVVAIRLVVVDIPGRLPRNAHRAVVQALRSTDDVLVVLLVRLVDCTGGRISITQGSGVGKVFVVAEETAGSPY